MMHVSPILEDKLIVGSCPTGETDIAQLWSKGVTAVLNLQTDEDLQQREIDWPMMESHYRRRGMEVRRFPILDFSPSDMRSKLRPAVRLLAQLIRAGHVVYLHCTAGINRAPTVAVAYLYWVEKWDLAAAHAYLLRCRPCDPYVEEVELATEE